MTARKIDMGNAFCASHFANGAAECRGRMEIGSREVCVCVLSFYIADLSPVLPIVKALLSSVPQQSRQSVLVTS